MICFLVIIVLCFQHLVFSSSVDKNKIEKANKIILNFKENLECRNDRVEMKNIFNNICSEMQNDDPSRPLLLDIGVFVFLKHFPDTFINVIKKIRTEVMLEKIFDPDFAALCSIKTVKLCPGNWLLIKYFLKSDEEATNGFLGAKRRSDILPLAIYNFVELSLDLPDLYHKNYNNTFMWFLSENDDSDDSLGNNFEQEEPAEKDNIDDLAEENSIFVMNLSDGSIQPIEEVSAKLEDLFGTIECLFQDDILSFVENGITIKTFKLLMQQDGRYVRRTKGDKIKYFFVESESTEKDTQLLLLKKSRLLISALPVLQIHANQERYFVIDFFRKYGIKDIREGESKKNLYIQSMIDEKYHQFTVVRQKGEFFKSYSIVEYCGLYEGIVSKVPKEYPFSNWLKLRFFPADDSNLPGALELRYADESTPLPFDNVVDISSAKCSNKPDDFMQGTNILFKTTDNRWYQFSTTAMIGALTNDENS